jgi:cystathionine beta-lyase
MNDQRVDFDTPISRAGTHSEKYEGRARIFGTDAVQPLWVADMDFAAPPAVTAALIARAQHPIYGYTDAPDSLYEAIQQWLQQRHQWSVAREDILLTAGVVGSLHAAALAFAGSGEGVIVQPPVYFPFFSAVTRSDRRLLLNPLIEQDGQWQIDVEHLEHCAADGAKALLFCSPHNPVGRVWRREELEHLLTIARRHQLVIFSDEIHADLIYPHQRHIPLATLALPGDRIVTAMAPSKTFNLPGLGLSYLISCDPILRDELREVLAGLHVGNSNPFSLTAAEAAYRHGGDWLDQLMAYLHETQQAVTQLLTIELPKIRVVPAEGTYLLWLDCRGLGLDDGELQRFFAHEAGLGLSAGTVFGHGGSGYMRLNIGAPRSEIMAAMRKLVAAWQQRCP